jgi:23S rRNA (cytidine1920-2'-O)/16S rRNA (cytidine1409-2'-O)-methyltransferase
VKGKAQGRQRLDCSLVERGLFETREKARRSIMAGEISIGDRVVDKPGLAVAADEEIRVKAANPYVSRGGVKLAAALDHFQIEPAGKICLDIGASTGGFTDCLLQRGAVKVHAIDVGHGQLDWKIRSDPRVAVREKLNARRLTLADVGEPAELCVIDVSFISLTLILPAAIQLVTPEGVVIALIKPQFELRREDVGKGGIVREPELHERAVGRIEAFVREKLVTEPGCAAVRWDGVIASPILGAEGNREFLACIRR